MTKKLLDKIDFENRPVDYVMELEGLRGIMAWWVVIGHMSLFAGNGGGSDTPWYQAIILRGAVPVEVFITISGFVIFFLLEKSRGSGFIPYITSRFFRIYPAFLVAFLLALLSLPLVSSSITSPWADGYSLSEKLARLDSTYLNLPQHIALHLGLLHGLVADQWLPYSGDAILGPAWSLSLEWQFYLVAPFLFALLGRRILLWMLACSVILGLKVLITRLGYTFSYGAFLPVKFEFFVLGMGSFLVWRAVAHGKPLWGALKPLFLGVVIAYVIMAFTGGMREHFYSLCIWMLVFMAALWRTTTGRANLISRTLCHPMVQYIGRVSYSTYIVHVVVITVVGALMVDLTNGLVISKNGAFLLMLTIGIPFIFGLSAIFYYFIEKPGIAFGKRFNAYWKTL